MSAGIHALDNSDHLSPGSDEMPGQVWYAWYNGRADVDIDAQWVRGSAWRAQRVHQYEATPRSPTGASSSRSTAPSSSSTAGPGCRARPAPAVGPASGESALRAQRALRAGGARSVRVNGVVTVETWAALQTGAH